MIQHSYGKSEYFNSYKDDIFGLLSQKFETITELNIFCIQKISEILGIPTQFINSVDLHTDGRKDDKLLQICELLGADEYISGPAAKNYIVDDKFLERNIKLHYYDYTDYPTYPQLWGEFDHYVSIIDLIFNCGEKAPFYIWGHRKNE